MNPTKVCPLCGLPKDIDSEFYKRGGSARPSSRCKQCTKETLVKWRAENSERMKEATRVYQAKHKHRLSAATSARSQKLRQACIDKLGGKCSWFAGCNWTDVRALHIDHTHGGGGKERSKLSPTVFYKRVITDTNGDYQLLCANHNCIKRIENGEHGHK